MRLQLTNHSRHHSTTLRRLTPTVAAIATILLTNSYFSVNAHEGATGIVKERMESMKTLGDHSKIVGNMLKGKQPFELSAVQTAASTFVTHGQQIPDFFPDTEASRHGNKTEALPAIWKDWEAFSALAERFISDSQLLVEVTASLEENAPSDHETVRQVRSVFFSAAKSCRQCHKKFRLERD